MQIPIFAETTVTAAESTTTVQTPTVTTVETATISAAKSTTESLPSSSTVDVTTSKPPVSCGKVEDEGDDEGDNTVPPDGDDDTMCREECSISFCSEDRHKICSAKQ